MGRPKKSAAETPPDAAVEAAAKKLVEKAAKRSAKPKTVKDTLPRGTPVAANGQAREGAAVSGNAFAHGAVLDTASARHQSVYEAYEAIIANGGSLHHFDQIHGFELPFPEKYEICARHMSGATVDLQRTFPAPAGERWSERIAGMPTWADLKAYLRRRFNGDEQIWTIAVRMGSQYPRCTGDERFERDPVRAVEFRREQELAMEAARTQGQPAAGQSQYGTTGQPANGINEMLLRAVLESRGVSVPASATGSNVNEQLLAAVLASNGKGGAIDANMVKLIVELSKPQKTIETPAPGVDPITQMLLKHFLEKDRKAESATAGTNGFWPAGVTLEPGTNKMFFHGMPIGTFGTAAVPKATDTIESYIEGEEKKKAYAKRLADAMGLEVKDGEKKDPDLFQEVGGWNLPLKDGDVDMDASIMKWAFANVDPAKKIAGGLWSEMKKAYLEHKAAEKDAVRSDNPRVQESLDAAAARKRNAEATAAEADAAAKIVDVEERRTKALRERVELKERLAKLEADAEEDETDTDSGDDDDGEGEPAPDSDRDPGLRDDPPVKANGAATDHA